MIKSAPFSIIRFEHPEDNDYSLDIPFSLPAFEQHEVAFQFIVDDDRALGSAIKLGLATPEGAFISAFTSSAINAVKLSYRYRLTGLLDYNAFDLGSIDIGGTLINYDVNVTRAEFINALYDDFGVEVIDDYFILTSNVAVSINALESGVPTSFDGAVTSYWHQAWIGVQGIDIEQTSGFTYALLNSDNSVIGYSNLFIPVDEEAFTSLLTYYGADNAFDFYYPAGELMPNRARVPIYLKQPQYPKTRTVNRNSKGQKQLLSSFVEKEYQVETDMMPEVFHEALAVAFAHDTCSVECPNIREASVDVIEADNYSPAWEDDNPQVAKGRGKIKVADYGYVNSNC